MTAPLPWAARALALTSLLLSACAATEPSLAPQLPQAWRMEDATGQPVPRHEAGFVEVGGKFYAFGGRRLRPVSVFDPATRRWQEASPPPVEVHHFQPVVVNGRIWLVGAMTGPFPDETPLPAVQVYDPATDCWSTGPEIPPARRRGGAGAVLHQGWIYLVGGIRRGHRGGFVPWLDRLNPSTGEWQALPDAPHARDHFQAAAIDGRVYAAGGRTTSRDTGQLFDLTVAPVDEYDIALDRWRSLPEPLPMPRAGNSTLALGPFLVVAGGESTRREAHGEVQALDTRSGDWLQLPPLARGRHGSGLVVHDGRLWTCCGGGTQGGGQELTTLESAALALAQGSRP